MPVKERTLIPRTSPFKSKAAGAPKPTAKLTKNAPITLRGTGRPISSQDSTSDKFTPLPPRTPLPQNKSNPSSSIGSSPSSTKLDHPKISGSRIPEPSQGSSVGLGLSLPAHGYPSKAAPDQPSPLRQRSPTRQIAQPRRFSRFHVPLIHSPAPKPLSAMGSSTSDGATTITGVAPPSPIPEIMTEEPPWKGTEMSRTPSMESGVSSTSAYTNSSAAETKSLYGLESEDKHGEKENAAKVQSPGFDMIEALASQEDRPPFPARSLAPIHSITQSQLTSRSTSLASTAFTPKPAASVEPQLVVTNASPRGKPVPPARPPFQRIATRSPSPRPVSEPLPIITNPRAPQALLHELEILVGKECMEECLDVKKVLRAHDAWRVRGPDSPSVNSGPVFGAPISATTHYASCSSVLGGRPHTLPLVVFATIEELYRAGLQSPRLLRPPPHSSNDTFPALVAAYNSSPLYGDDIDLASAPLDDVSALLLTYLDCLPGPVLAPPLRSAFVELCVRPHMEGHEEGKPAPQQFRAAQLLLRLLPAPHFSLLVYLLAFLSQLPLHERWNGWSVRGVARAFARAVVGIGGEDCVDWVVEEENAVSTLAWLIRNWDDLSDGLFKAGGGEQRARGRLSMPLAREREQTLDRRSSRVFGGDTHDFERDVHRATALRKLDPTVHPDTPRRLQEQEMRAMHAQHDAELRAMFDEGERQLEEAVLAERRCWVAEVQALREGCERMRRAWDVAQREREELEMTVSGVVVRLAKVAPRRG